MISPDTTHHVIVAAQRLSREESPLDTTLQIRREANIDRVTSAKGASLLFHPIRQAAVALEEWVRYPVPSISDRNLLDGFSFIGDFIGRTANTTFLLLGSMPEFLMRDHEQAAEFVASLPALLQSWMEEIRSFDEKPSSWTKSWRPQRRPRSVAPRSQRISRRSTT